MQDFDWIEVGFIFDDLPEETVFSSLLETFPLLPDKDLESGQCWVSSYDEDGSSNRRKSDIQDTVTTMVEPGGFRIKSRFNGFYLSMSEDSGMGLLSQLPHLIFREEIFAFRSADPESEADYYSDRRRDFVETLAKAAEILDPQWAFGRRGGLAIGEDQSIEELTKATRPPLYEYNVFREETVEAIGRERVLDAPAWYVEELDTGGVFLAVREPPSSCSTHSEDYVEVADYLGLPVAEISRYY